MSNAYSQAVNTWYWSTTPAVHQQLTQDPGWTCPATLITVCMSHMDTTLLRGSGGYMLTSVSLANSSSVSTLDGVSRWHQRNERLPITHDKDEFCLMFQASGYNPI
jgi:hypothetical protein